MAPPEHPVSFETDDVDYELPDQTAIIAWLESVARAEHKSLYEVGYIFCSDEKLREINIEYLQHDYYTDVITFDYTEADNIEGEVYISIDRVAENAQTNQVSQLNELCRVMVHAVLHMAGYGDKTDDEAAIMRQKEAFYLAQYPFL
jgi:probable rRNA maturation factor